MSRRPLKLQAYDPGEAVAPLNEECSKQQMPALCGEHGVRKRVSFVVFWNPRLISSLCQLIE
jgi:hypothetical protein